MQIINPSTDSTDFAALPMAVREEIRSWIWAFNNIPPCKPISTYFEIVAQRIDSKPGTVKAKYYALVKHNNWRTLVDLRKQKQSSITCRTNDRSFQDYFKLLCEQNQRSTDAAIRMLYRRWKNREVIPGYTDLPGYPQIPKGWSKRNLQRLASNALELSLMRQGIKTSSHLLPQIYSTRVNLWPGAFYQFDDVWHDNYVRIGNDVTRVLELGALDVLSGCRFAFGAKPRMLKGSGGGRENLNEKEMRMFLCRVLYQEGINTEKGTTLVIENGTATVRDDVERLLTAYGTLADGSPMIKISRSGLQGKQQAVLNMWGGRAGGNPRHKASLESLHNLIHNELAGVIGQTGHDRTEPEMTHGVVSYQERLLKTAEKIPANRRELLKHPILDFHSQFFPLLCDLYEHAINGRTDHKLQGWSELGFIKTEYTAMPGSDQWLTLDMIPEQSRQIITTAARQDPKTWSRTRQLSPLEVWSAGKNHLTPVSPYLICDILGKDFAKERKVKGGYITFTDESISPEPVIYQSRIITPAGRQEELQNGTSIMVFSNPFDPAQLFICDDSYSCLGIAPRITRVNPADDAQVIAEYGKRNERKADVLEPLRARHQPVADAAQALRKHNAEVADLNHPITADEISTQREIKSATTRLKKASKKTSRTGMSRDNLLGKKSH